MRSTIDASAIVRPAEDLDVLAKRVAEREKKNLRGQLDHVKRQAADVYAARQKAKHGEWAAWCNSAGLSKMQAWRYAEFGKVTSTLPFSSLNEDDQWGEWQRISGNSEPQPTPEISPFGSVNDCELLNTAAPRERSRVRRDDEREDEFDDDDKSEEQESDEPEKFDGKYSVNRFHLVVSTAIELASSSEKLFSDLVSHKKVDSEMIRGVRLIIDTWTKIARQLEGK